MLMVSVRKDASSCCMRNSNIASANTFNSSLFSSSDWVLDNIIHTVWKTCVSNSWKVYHLWVWRCIIWVYIFSNQSNVFNNGASFKCVIFPPSGCTIRWTNSLTQCHCWVPEFCIPFVGVGNCNTLGSRLANF